MKRRTRPYFYADPSDPQAREFDKWMVKVDSALVRSCGLGMYDIPDVKFHNYFDDGLDPEYAAELAYQHAQSL